MTHTDIIWIVVTLGLSSTLGVYAAIRYINLHTRPPVNTLVRSGDIELVDYIEPTHVRDIDLSSLPQFPQVMVNNPLPIRWEHPPRYSQLTNNFINSSFENSINLDFIWIILLFLVLLIGLVYLNKPINNFPILSNDISTQEITYTNIYQEIHKNKRYLITYGKNYTYFLFTNWTIFDIKEWMRTFDDIDYAVTIELIGDSYPDVYRNMPRLILSWEFIVNKGSSPLLISTHIKKQSENLIDLFDLEFDNDYSGYIGPKPSILINFTELNYSK
jgi:hypothetical protein